MSALVSRRQAVACSGAVLVAHVGLAHEVIGTVVYPYGPGVFGGPVGWHAAGRSAVASGLLVAVGVLGFIRVPAGLLATAASGGPRRTTSVGGRSLIAATAGSGPRRLHGS